MEGALREELQVRQQELDHALPENDHREDAESLRVVVLDLVDDRLEFQPGDGERSDGRTQGGGRRACKRTHLETTSQASSRRIERAHR